MLGEKHITNLALWVSIIFTPLSLFAFENIIVQQQDSTAHQLGHSYSFSGADNGIVGGSVQPSFFVVNNKEPMIYQLNMDTNKLVPYKKLDELYGYYDYAKSAPANKKFDLEGVSSCPTSTGSMAFYVVNEKNGGILKAEGKYLTTLKLNYSNFPDFKYNSGDDGFTGVTADCANQKLYVSKQKNPNIVFAIDLKQNAVIREFDLSTGSDVEDDISDLFFSDNKLYVLQKNKTGVLVIDPSKSGNNYLVRNYDYSVMDRFAKTGEKGIAEGLVVKNKSIFLFLDQGKTNHTNIDKSKDVIIEFKI